MRLGRRSPDSAIRALLVCGVAVPVIYFGLPLVAAPFYPGYSFLRNTASDLGTQASRFPELVNLAIGMLGVITMLAAVGVALGLRRLGVRWPGVALCGLCVASCGLASLLSGLYPEPDPRHGGGAWGAGTFLLPFVFAPFLWKLRPTTGLKAYLIANAALFVGMVPVMAGATGLNLNEYHGLLQRILAFTAFVPVGVVSAFLASRIAAARRA